MTDRDEDQGITAYHGSPHEFDQFDLSKIGTGEGAQRYGHGLYFAEHEPVAEEYKNVLSSIRPNPVMVDNQKYSDPTPMQNLVIKHLGNVESAYKAMMPKWQAAQDRYANSLIDSDDIEKILAEIDHRDALSQQKELESMRGKNVSLGKPGHMYEVSINAHPDHFLDWDKPLSEQSEHVRNTISNLFGSIPENKIGREIYEEAKNFARRGNLPPEYVGNVHENASRLLKDAGLHGIKYLDAGSRGKEDGTRNYVVFDDKLVNVKRRYAHGGEVQSYADGGSIGIGGMAAFGDPSKGPDEYGVTTPMEVRGNLLLGVSPEQREYLSSEMTKQMNANPSSTANSPLAAGIESYDAEARQARDDARRAEQQALRDAAVQRAAGTTVAEKAPQATGMFAPPAQTTAFGSGIRDVGFPPSTAASFAKAPVSQTSDTRAAPKTIRQTFNQAFADAKAAGLKQFTWVNPATGKAMVYTTQLARKEGGRVPSFANPDDWIASTEKPRQIAKRSSVRKAPKVEGTAIVKRALMLSSRKS